MSDIVSILTELGYSPRLDKDGWRMAALYRHGDNNTSLKVYSNGWCHDFVTGEKFRLETLIQKTLNIDEANAKDWLTKKADIGSLYHVEKEKIKLPEIFDNHILNDLIPDFSYWKTRGISSEIASIFKGGLCIQSESLLGKLRNRQILIIYNGQKQIVGLTGRSLDDRTPKWKHIGTKTNWVWPGYLNSKLIKSCKQVILVESPADILKLWECGIYNAICLFGTECSFAILNFLLKVNPNIIIATNNEDSQIGNKAAEKIYNKLKRYFNLNQLQIILPYKKDFGEMSCEEIYTWMKDNNIKICNS